MLPSFGGEFGFPGFEVGAWPVYGGGKAVWSVSLFGHGGPTIGSCGILVSRTLLWKIGSSLQTSGELCRRGVEGG